MSDIDPPEGRGPDAHPTTTSIASARFPYRCTFIPNRGRKRRTAYLTGECFVNVRRLEVSEAGRRLAYRVRFPFRFTQNYALSDTTFEILAFEGRLWWPLTDEFSPEIYPNSIMRPDAFLRGLEGETDFFGADHVLDLATTERIRSTSRIEDEDQDAVAARVQCTVVETILFVGDAVYAVGGEPVYVQRKLHGNPRDITVASLYPNRAVESGSLLQLHPGYMEFAGEYLERGAFYLGDQIGRVQAAAASIGMAVNELPTIEVLMPDLVRLSRDDIRTDALFRYAIATHRPWQKAGSSRVTDVVDMMKSLAERRQSSATTTEDRFKTLVDLTRAIQADEGFLKGCDDFGYLLRNLKPLAASLAPDGDAMTPEDDEALAGFA